MPVSISIKKSQKQPVLLKYRVKCQDRTGSRDCDIKILPDRKTLTIRPVGDIKETFDLADDAITVRNLRTGRFDEVKDINSSDCLVLSTNRSFKPFYFITENSGDIIKSINLATKHWDDLFHESPAKFLFKSSMETFQDEIFEETSIIVKKLKKTLMWYNFDDNQISAMIAGKIGKVRDNESDIMTF